MRVSHSDSDCLLTDTCLVSGRRLYTLLAEELSGYRPAPECDIKRPLQYGVLHQRRELHPTQIHKVSQKNASTI